MTIGQLCRELLTQPKWCNTMLPRIPVKIARDIENKLKEHDAKHQKTQNQIEYTSKDPSTSERHRSRSRDRYRRRSRSRYRRRSRSRSRSRDRYSRSSRSSRYADDRRRYHSSRSPSRTR
jgi:pre-mRNA-splicing factor 38B